MGQDASQERAQAVTSEELREEIEEVRRDLGDTAAALAAKTDVKTRAGEKADELKQRASAKAEELKQRAQANPVPIAAAAGAFVLTLLITRRRGRR
jgi:glutamate/tyrosine decarboxylase-like PLP-dependent enzyme